MIALNQLIANKQSVVNKVVNDRLTGITIKTADREKKLEYIKQTIDFREVDDIFDDIVDEQLNQGLVFSLINMSMVCVMAISGYLWWKLNKAEAF